MSEHQANDSTAPSADPSGPDATIYPSQSGAGLEQHRNRTRRQGMVIRPVEARDAGIVMELFRDGSLSGESNHGQEAADLEDLDRHYIHNDSAWLWVAEGEAGEPALVGMVAVRIVGDDVAELRRLRVHTDFRKQGIGRALVEHALQHCREHEFLKVVLDTFVERQAAIGLFEQFGFRHARSRESDGRPVLDFYLDLYSEARDDQGSGPPATA
jgi:ribosomal protein S18 acetylase RimI-like enzyme